ncbi:MAG: hypothetical protein IPK79_08830 [Vampirovibrionales bacterium]|nr:hypothetical protein [Vampirovibrionales bacterium]
MRVLFRLLAFLLLTRFVAGLVGERAPRALTGALDLLLNWLTPPATLALNALAQAIPPSWATWLPAPSASRLIDAIMRFLTGAPWPWLREWFTGRVEWTYLLTLGFAMALAWGLQLMRATGVGWGREAGHRQRLRQMQAGHERQIRALEATRDAAPGVRERDPLSGLFQRAWFFHALERELQQATQSRQPISAVLFRLGGAGGLYGETQNPPLWADETFRQAAQPVLSLMTPRENVIACRYEPSAIAVILVGASPQEVDTFVERLQAYWSNPQQAQADITTPIASAAGALTVAFAPAPGREAEKPPHAERLAQQLEALAYEAHLQGPGERRAHVITLH